MSASPRTTTPPREKLPLFEPPELVIEEDLLLSNISLPVNAENFSRLIASNFLVAMCARDRKLQRKFFEEVLVTTFNLQNRLVRISVLNVMLEQLAKGEGFSSTEIRTELARHMESALEHQTKLVRCVQLFKEMRAPGDPVS